MDEKFWVRVEVRILRLGNFLIVRLLHVISLQFEIILM